MTKIDILNWLWMQCLYCLFLLIWVSLVSPFPSAGVSSNQVVVPEKVNAVLGKNITLGCRIEVGSNLSLTQISWERRLPSGPSTLAVFNPVYGISISQEYAKRISFVSPSIRDATITLEGVGFGDVGSYTCKVATFPLGNTQASITVNVLGKVDLCNFQLHYLNSFSTFKSHVSKATIGQHCWLRLGKA